MVLAIAEAASPELTSVPLLGWSHTLALSSICDVHLATQVRNQHAIERFVWKRFEGLLKHGRFDLVHRITPVSPTAPSYLAKRLKKIGVPFVVAPLNGGVAWPRQFVGLQHKEKEWLSHVRGAYKLLPGYASLRRDCACLIAGSMATKGELPPEYADKTLYLPENAVDTSRFSMRNNSSYELPIRAAFVGRLVPYKGADMAIEAMQDLLRGGHMTYDIYGSGPEEDRLRKMVTDMGLNDHVTFHGFVPNQEIQHKLVKTDLLVFPSIREFGGGVVLEAMALGVVPVIADYAGPSELVTSSSGYRVPMGTREELIAGFRDQLKAICDQPEALIDKREGALDRCHHFYTWDVKAEQMKSIYRWILKRGDKPDYHTPSPIL